MAWLWVFLWVLRSADLYFRRATLRMDFRDDTDDLQPPDGVQRRAIEDFAVWSQIILWPVNDLLVMYFRARAAWRKRARTAGD